MILRLFKRKGQVDRNGLTMLGAMVIGFALCVLAAMIFSPGGCLNSKVYEKKEEPRKYEPRP